MIQTYAASNGVTLQIFAAMRVVSLRTSLPAASCSGRPHGDFVAASDGATIKLLDPEHELVIAALSDDTDTNSVTALAFSRDVTNILAAASGRVIKLWDLKTRQAFARFKGRNEARRADLVFLALSPDGKILAVGDRGPILGDRSPSIWLWDIQTQAIRWSGETHVGHAGVLTFTTDGRSVISGG